MAVLVKPLFCYAVLGVLSRLAIILLRTIELVVLLMFFVLMCMHLVCLHFHTQR